MSFEYIIFIIINSVSFILFGLDKMFAKAHMFRIPEKILLSFAFIGAPGAIAGMVLFNHKTSKIKFRYTVPVMFILHLAVLLYFLR